MNCENRGIPIANIYKSDKKRIVDTLYVNEFDGDSSYKCKDNEYIQLIPKPKVRSVIFATGASGSGKSYFMKRYIQEYKDTHKNNPVYIFSSLKTCETLDTLKFLKRIDITDPEFLTEEWEIDDFADCCVCFDDTDCIMDKAIREKVNSLLNLCLETGRHSNTEVLYSSHQACKGSETKTILNEAHAICFFPRAMGGRSLTYLAETHLGLSKTQIAAIKKTRSRHVCYVKCYPNLLLFDKECRLLD